MEAELINVLRAILKPLLREIIFEIIAESKTQEKLIDVTELAEVLGMSESFLGIEARAGRIPSIKIGANRKYFLSEVVRQLKKRNG